VITALAVSLALLLLLPPRPRAHPAPKVIGAIAAGLGMVVFVEVRPPIVLVVLASAVGGVVARHWRRRRAAVHAARRRTAVLAACEGLAADLTAGLSPEAALSGAAKQWPEFGPVFHASRLGADVPMMLRELAGLPGASALRHVAAAWTVAHRSGAGLAESIGLAARRIREDRALERTVEAELAAAVATARLLAILPLPVLLIGRGAGGDPFAFLLFSTPGQACLAGGLLLSWLGSVWLDRIADGIRQA
jgi:tight adherence protein B